MTKMKLKVKRNKYQSINIIKKIKIFKPCKVVDVNGRDDICPRPKNRNAAILSEPSCLEENEDVLNEIVYPKMKIG